jgi:hypothetical protein
MEWGWLGRWRFLLLPCWPGGASSGADPRQREAGWQMPVLKPLENRARHCGRSSSVSCPYFLIVRRLRRFSQIEQRIKSADYRFVSPLLNF